jgi:MFS family permease
MSVGNQTLIQASVDPDLRGRVVSLYGMVAQDVPAVGAMMMGGFAEHLGLQLPVAVGAGICLLLWWWGLRQRGWMAAAAEADAAREGGTIHGRHARPSGEPS